MKTKHIVITLLTLLMLLAIIAVISWQVENPALAKKIMQSISTIVYSLTIITLLYAALKAARTLK